MEKLKRALHIDFHTMPGIYDFGREFDAAEFAKTLSDAHITLVNMFAQCNIGFAYYDTDIGIRYPGMKGSMLGDSIKECHKRGIKVVAYINVGLNHEYARRHYDQCRIDAEGRVLRGDRNANFFRTLCYNTAYGDYLLSVISEILEKCDPDGIFCDCMSLEPCWCNKCTEDMIARGIDIGDRAAVTAFSHQNMLNISRRIRDIVPRDKLLYLNGMEYAEVSGLDSHIEVECLPSGGWGYDSFVPSAAYARNLQENVIYMTGRFQESWGDFGGLKSRASIENDVYDALCQGTAWSVGDHMHPATGLDRDTYRMIGEIYKNCEKYEKWTDGAKYLPEVGFVINRSQFTNARRGAARIFGELKLNFDVVDETMDFDRFRLLVVCEDTVSNKAVREKVTEFASHGKPVLFCGAGILDETRTKIAYGCLSDMLDFDSVETSDRSFYHSENTLPGCSDMPYATYSSGVKVRAKDAHTLATHVKPYFEPHWDGLQGYFYTPPEKEDGFTAAAFKGNIGFISFGLFTAYNRAASVFHKELLRSLLDKIYPEKLIAAPSLPSTSRATLLGGDCYELLCVKTTFPEHRGRLDVIEEHVTLPSGRQISLLGEFSDVTSLDGAQVSFSAINGRTTVTLPQITGFTMLLCKK